MDALRDLDRRINDLLTSDLYIEGRPSAGYAIGSTGERTNQEAEALMSLRRHVLRGSAPDEAAPMVKAEILAIIRRHNGRRHGDVNWQVSESYYDTLIDTWARRLAVSDAITARG